MGYICPNCNEQLYKINKKLVCGNEKCNFQCLELNYDRMNQPWNILLCKHAEIGNENIFQRYPYIIAKEYKRLFSLLEDNKLYGAIFQIKDLFEVLLKLPTLLALNQICNNKNRTQAENEVLQFFLSKMLSLGDWQELAKKCLVLCSSENLKEILENIIKTFEKNKITRWRNETIGHGALMFDDTDEFRKDLEKMLEIIKKHFEECNEQYLQISLKYEIYENVIDLRGIDLNNEIFKLEGNLILDEDKNVIKINELIKVYKENIFFFDSFCQWDGKTKMICYLNAQIVKLKSKYFEEMFKNLSKYTALRYDIDSSRLDDEIYTETEENIIKSISKIDQVVIPDFLYKWVDNNLEANNKGIYLLQMEKGMGKTTFSKIIDPLMFNKKKFNKTAVRAYYVNSTYSYKVKSFENDIVELLKISDDKTDKFKGNIPQFSNQLGISCKEQFIEILKNFKNMHQKKFGKEKLLVIIDGVDEIPDLSGKTILDYIPQLHEIPNNVYILITSRMPEENPQYINLILDRYAFTAKMQVLKNNEEYNLLLKNYIVKKIGITNPDLITSIIKHSDNKFLFVKPIEYIIKYNNISDLSKIDIFEEFLNILEKNYIEKYFFQIVEILTILAISREGLTIEEISYLLTDEPPSFKTLAYLADVSCLLKLDRTYRGTIISLSHESLRSFILEKYQKRIHKFIDKWIESISDMNCEKLNDAEKNIFFNILYLTKRYRPEKVEELINFDNMKLETIYLRFSSEQLTEYDIHLLLQFIDDLISILESNPEKNAINLILTYIFRMQAFIKYAFGGEILYYNYIDRALEIMEMYSIENKDLKLQAYKLRCEYYRKIGNIKKSMDDNKIIEGLLESNDDFSKIEKLFIDRMYMLLNKSINFKNLGEIDNALECALEAKLHLEENNTLEGQCLYSNVLNTLGLCYLRLTKLDVAEEYIRKSIQIMKSVNKEEGNLVDNIFNNYANLGQVLRKKGQLNEAIEIYTQSINEIIIHERKGYLIDGNQKALHYNGRANVFRDLAQSKDDTQIYEKAIYDYIEAIKVVEGLERKNQDLRFLGQLYKNIITLYEVNLDEKCLAKLYKDKLDNLNRELLRTYLDLNDEDDIVVDDKIYTIQATQCLTKADEFIEKNELKEAISLCCSTIDLIKKIKSFNENKEQLSELLAVAYYNKALCAHKLLSEKINQDFQMRIQGENKVNDYSQFSPEKIIEDYLMSESYVTMDMDLKCRIYESVSYIYCEAIRNYDKAKSYALKSIQIKDDSGGAYTCLGNAYCELGEYMNAAKYYKKSLEIIPEDISVQNNLDYVNFKLKEKMLQYL